MILCISARCRTVLGHSHCDERCEETVQCTRANELAVRVVRVERHGSLAEVEHALGKTNDANSGSILLVVRGKVAQKLSNASIIRA